MSVNKCIFIGNLGADPEVKQFSNGSMVANVSLACSEKWRDKTNGEQKEHTEWIKVQFNNRLAEVAAQYLRKGSSVYVEGRLRTRKYQDQNGQDRYVTEIKASNMQMLGGNTGQGGYQQQQNNGHQQQNGFNQNAGNPQSMAVPQHPADDDIPFN